MIFLNRPRFYLKDILDYGLEHDLSILETNPAYNEFAIQIPNRGLEELREFNSGEPLDFIGPDFFLIVGNIALAAAESDKVKILFISPLENKSLWGILIFDSIQNHTIFKYRINSAEGEEITSGETTFHSYILVPMRLNQQRIRDLEAARERRARYTREIMENHPPAAARRQSRGRGGGRRRRRTRRRRA